MHKDNDFALRVIYPTDSCGDEREITAFLGHYRLSDMFTK